MKDVSEAEADRFIVHTRELAEKKGRTPGRSPLMIIRNVMNSVIQYVGETGEQENIPYEMNSYEVFRLGGINYERLRMTHMNGMADGKILDNVFCGITPDRIFHYNGGTADIIENPGFFPQSIKESIRIGNMAADSGRFRQTKG